MKNAGKIRRRGLAGEANTWALEPGVTGTLPSGAIRAATDAGPGDAGGDRKDKKPAAKKAKLVRDSFTFPAEEHAQLGELKQRALGFGREIKKSELLRAGLAALAAMPDAVFLSAIDGVERIKTGRPAK